MNGFKKQRFPKTCIALYIIAALTMFAIPVRIFLGDVMVMPNEADFSAFTLLIAIIAAVYLICMLALWLPLRKKGIRFMDIFYPLGTLGAITIFIYFHFTWFA